MVALPIVFALYDSLAGFVSAVPGAVRRPVVDPAGSREFLLKDGGNGVLGIALRPDLGEAVRSLHQFGMVRSCDLSVSCVDAFSLPGCTWAVVRAVVADVAAVIRVRSCDVSVSCVEGPACMWPVVAGVAGGLRVSLVVMVRFPPRLHFAMFLARGFAGSSAEFVDHLRLPRGAELRLCTSTAVRSLSALGGDCQ